jgi:hypothetical protein
MQDTPVYLQDAELRSIMYTLDEVSETADVGEVLATLDGIRALAPTHRDTDPHEYVYGLINEYRNGFLSLYSLKEEIRALLHEWYAPKKERN